MMTTADPSENRTPRRSGKKVISSLVFSFLVFILICMMYKTDMKATMVFYLETMMIYLPQDANSKMEVTPSLNLAVSICGNRFEEAIVMLKSVTLFTRTPFHVHVFASDDLKGSLQNELYSWQQQNKTWFNFTLYPNQFSSGMKDKQWINLFRPCASQKLFIPTILNETDALLYVDTDVLFLRSLEDIWKNFVNFNETQIAALAAESESSEGNWYMEHKNTPRVSTFGVNSGVFLMNATRMRQTDWLKNITDIYTKYRSVIELGDQDIVNIYFHNYPEQLIHLGCNWNYRTDHCEYSCNCTEADDVGVGLVHGNRHVFHNNRIPIFRQLYQTFHEYEIGDNAERHFNKSIHEILLKITNSSKCSKAKNVLFRHLLENLPSSNS